jgi:hypothetical protein
MANFELLFSVQRTGGSPTGPDPVNGVGDQDNGIPGRPVSSGLQVPGKQEQDRLGDLPHVRIFMNDGPNPLT